MINYLWSVTTALWVWWHCRRAPPGRHLGRDGRWHGKLCETHRAYMHTCVFGLCLEVAKTGAGAVKARRAVICLGGVVVQRKSGMNIVKAIKGQYTCSLSRLKDT